MKYLALDYGSKRIGVAVSDDTGSHVFPRNTIVNSGKEVFFSEIRKLIKEEAIEKIVVGMPLTMRGERGPQALEVQNAIHELQEAINVPIDFEDERMSSTLADRFTGSSFSRDSLAAAAILETYLARRRGA